MNASSFYGNLIWAFRLSKHKISVGIIHPCLCYWGYKQNSWRSRGLKKLNWVKLTTFHKLLDSFSNSSKHWAMADEKNYIARYTIS